MSYYILPKNNNIIDIDAKIDEHKISIITSYSIYNYYCEVKKQLIKILSENIDIQYNNIEHLFKEFNPYEYIFSKVPGSKYSVSKLKTKTNLFYEFLEISNTLNCFESFKNSKLKFIYMGDNFNDIVECLNLFRENSDDEIVHHNESIKENKYDFLFCEMEPNYENSNVNNYILYFVKTIFNILKYQVKNGTCIIQINHTIHKPIIELLYLIT